MNLSPQEATLIGTCITSSSVALAAYFRSRGRDVQNKKIDDIAQTVDHTHDIVCNHIEDKEPAP
jgi:hypothetical protein